MLSFSSSNSLNSSSNSNAYIDWLVTVNVSWFTTLQLTRQLINLYMGGSVTSLMNYVGYLLMLFLLIYQYKHYGFILFNRKLFLFIAVYCVFIFNYIFISPKIKIDDILFAPHTLIGFINRAYMLFGALLCTEAIIRHFNHRNFLLISIILCTFPAFLYVRVLGLDLLLLLNSMNDEEVISAMTLSYSLVPVCVLSLYYVVKHIGEDSVWSSIIGLFFLLNFYLIFSMGERGPILCCLASWMSCLFFRYGASIKVILWIAVALCVLYANADFLLDILENYLPNTADRIRLALEGDSSARIETSSGKDGTWVMGWYDIIQNPVWGHYFRITGFSGFYGLFPHNIFIEMLMTMGLVGFIPFMLILLSTVRKCFSVFMRIFSYKMEIFLMLFIMEFVRLQVSSTIVFDTQFWFTLYVLASIDDNRILNIITDKNEQL